MQTRNTLLLTGLGVLGALGLGWVLFKRDGDGDTLDRLGDAVALLTSSEESRLSSLEPETQSAVRQLIADLATQGVSVHVGQTLRTQADEKADIAAGKSAVKTHSWHEIARAVDMYPIDPDTGQPDLNGKRDDLFQTMVATARNYGLKSLAYNDDWTRHYIHGTKGPVWDGGHLEYHGPYATIADAVDAEGATYGIG